MAEQRRDRAALLIAVPFGVVALGLLLGAAGAVADASDFLRHARSTEGVVTAIPNGGAHPRIRFAPEPGSVIDFQQNAHLFGSHREGERVTVLFDPVDPAGSARLSDFDSLWGLALMLGLLGAGFAAATAAAVTQGLTGRRLVGRP